MDAFNMPSLGSGGGPERPAGEIFFEHPVFQMRNFSIRRSKCTLNPFEGHFEKMHNLSGQDGPTCNNQCTSSKGESKRSC
eukprot:785316-Pelagomonas_calceolata.AAC.1